MRRAHSANELIDRANLLGPDGVTLLASNVACGISDVTGDAENQIQLTASTTKHLIIFRAADASVMPTSGYVAARGLLYIVDYTEDDGLPRPGTWTEVYCHVERSGN